jgi:hypothetical protein
MFQASLCPSSGAYQLQQQPLVYRRNVVVAVLLANQTYVSIVTGIGSSTAISTSKIIKITAIKRNRDEKGSRAEFFGSNPHSNGDLFSRSSLIFF